MNKDLSPDLNNGITRAIFIYWGTTPELRGKSIIYVNGAQIKLKVGLHPCTWQTSGEEFKTSVTQKENVRVFVWKSIWKNIISYYSQLINNHDAEVYPPIASCYF